MSGRFGGTQSKFKELYPRMVYVYCAGHDLNLVVKETMLCFSVVATAVSVVREVCNFISNSPKSAFEQFMKNLKSR